MKAKAMNLKDKKVLVMGLGRFGGGIGVCKFLVKHQAQVTVTDLGTAEKLAGSVAQLQGLPLTFHLGEHREEDFISADLIVVNPAVPKHSPWRQLAIEHRIPMTSEMNLFLENCSTKNIVAITGSNGKSTTTAMIHHVLQTVQERGKLGGKVFLGGNIGKDNLLSRLEEIGREDYIVLELSSFQLCDLAALTRSPHVSVVTNITPNHLDWHQTMEHYIWSKQNIIRFQDRQDYAILNAEDAALGAWPQETKGHVCFFRAEDAEPLHLQVPGRHNLSNAAGALAAAQCLQLPEDITRTALESYHALPHRLELVRTLDTVRFYNDSIATTPESVIAAIASFKEPKVIILGGYDKKIPFDALIEACQDNVHAVILIGQVREKLQHGFAAFQQQHGGDKPKVILADSFAEAVRLAYENAPRNSAVLMSPACASYDMFTNFEQRGQMFRELVQRL